MQFNSLIKKVLAFSSWTTFSQVLGIAFLPVLVRLYSPEGFGELGIFTSYVAVLSAVIALRFDYAITAADEGDELNLLSLAFMVSCASLPLVMVIIQFLVSLEDALIITLTSFVVIVFNSCQSYLVRVAKIGKASKMVFFRTVLMLSLQLALSHFNKGLIYGYTLSFILVTVLYFPFGEMSFHFRDLRLTFRKYSNFCKFNFPHTLLNTLGNNMPYFVFNILYSKEVVGYFTLAMKVIQVPHRFVSSALRLVITSHLKNLSKVDKDKTLKNCTLVLSVASFIIFTPIIFFSKPLFIFLLGESWQLTAEMVSILAFWFACSFCNIPSFSILTVSNKLKKMFQLECGSIFLRILLFYIAIVFNMSALSVLGYYSLIGVAFNFVVIFTAFSVSLKTEEVTV
ncbi:MAG: oligosaccharide flippase family protein [Lentisphaeraceae bacterium]|nr:oligosaccharide flippase family protein [Lentisphaeraceae bacterium]